LAARGNRAPQARPPRTPRPGASGRKDLELVNQSGIPHLIYFSGYPDQECFNGLDLVHKEL